MAKGKIRNKYYPRLAVRRMAGEWRKRSWPEASYEPLGLGIPFILSGAEFIAERSQRGDDKYHSRLA